MIIVDIGMELASNICGNIHSRYHLSNYLVLRKKHRKEEIFCFAGSDITNADNIVVFMNKKNDGYVYSFSDELADIS